MGMKDELIQPDRGGAATTIRLVTADTFDRTAITLSGPQRSLLAAQRFTGKAGQTAILPDGEGWLALGGVPDKGLSSWCLARLAEVLPAGTYRLAEESGFDGVDHALLGWQTAQYRFDRYAADAAAEGPRVLLTGKAGAIAGALAEARAVQLVRDLVNTPAEDMGPAALEQVAAGIVAAHRAELTVTRGEQLEADYPMIHAVGRAAARHHAPRLLHLTWGRPDAPVLALVGKGVCFDSGGLDIKPSAGMLLMKKDMGGAAHALALARLVMEAGLDVRLHCLVPAVENAIAGNAFRPGDVLRSRKGLSVEIGNTDAEGRLILADALTRASEESPALMLDFATLTGAARVALGPDLPALFARTDATADALLAAGRAQDDPVWRLPLHAPYAEGLKSDIADINNATTNSFAGAVTAAIFLDRFVGQDAAGQPIDWAHFDTFAWNPAPRPGRPRGGEALGLRAAWHMLQGRFGS
ncbi:cytosol aminopeptidase [Croceibacterium mercuriale]|uniref:Cytosol aminopeptidase n=1 Tax=Croceibacterium mercuriale TaxID=1572751 RepID=A0A0B2C2Q8_9SPHN|nr:leucyl aminopeptidase family protein [Croceibacterium mercuriale]KHL26460.1 cytosol aminopeptidase [Croceibacterium mercuriale]